MEPNEIAGLLMFAAVLFGGIMWAKSTEQKVLCPFRECKHNEKGRCYKAGTIDLESVTTGHNDVWLRCRRYTVKHFELRG